ncbi:TetR/AcrR family transcriptional regulator [Luteolibacter ambystomatis]|uniref:TetR/AcrR family transcriptional regulator n=1 Tax=Luteolibacter ambystomatis TaxID=2824561 RepID=A0A975PH63_9BACT|nr:TetR/AcrR family transcriptional regulator [Luteolibacter ambystomatis]QUE52961.1 TetR/AcrR family transcriptional regulator [Luteolibacter ambystomatis]
MNHPKSPTGIGRPRAFDAEEALEKALRVFWEKGYEGTSMNDLTAAMGINRPSLYAAFGNKESLFRKALARYTEGPAAYVKTALSLPTARQTAEALLQGAVEMMANPDHPRGCFAIQSALACGDEAAPVRDELVSARCSTLVALEDRFQRAQKAGEFPKGTDPARLARYIATVMQGMSVQAASGTTVEDLRGIAEQAMLAWPS